MVETAKAEGMKKALVDLGDASVGGDELVETEDSSVIDDLEFSIEWALCGVAYDARLENVIIDMRMQTILLCVRGGACVHIAKEYNNDGTITKDDSKPNELREIKIWSKLRKHIKTILAKLHLNAKKEGEDVDVDDFLAEATNLVGEEAERRERNDCGAESR